MTRNGNATLRELFLLGLASAGAACAASSPGTGDGTGTRVTLPDPSAAPSASAAPDATPVGRADPEKDPQRYATEFAAAPPYARAIKSGELLGFVDAVDGKLRCTPAPCSKEWEALVDRAGAHFAVVRKDGALKGVTAADFDAAVGPVDAPEKAALRARLEDYRQPATCQHFADMGFSCRAGSTSTGVPVRTTNTGYEVAIYDERNVCEGGQMGSALALGIMPVTREGTVDIWFQNGFTQLVAAKVARDKKVQCQYPTRGRMIEGFVDLPAPRDVLTYFVCAWRQESAAVLAFERLARELAVHGAPVELVADARRSADDERRHAALFDAAARRHCGALGLDEVPCAPALAAPTALRPLAAVLEENVAEGCANETLAAVVATHQALAAPTAELRALFAAIADDERAHAALAYRIHAWGQARLGAEDAARLERTRREACDALAQGAAASEVGVAWMGEPDAAVARAAFAHVAVALAAA